MRLALIVAALLGLATVAYLIVDIGAADVAQAMLLVGWGLIPVSLFHLVPLFFSTLSWRSLLSHSSRPRIRTLIWIRWIRESITSLLPVAGVGGDLASAPTAAASMIVDVTVGAATQMIFVAIGVALLLTRSSGPQMLAVAWAVLLGIGIFFIGIAAFLLLQHRGLFAVSVRLAGGLLRDERLSRMAGGASAIDNAIVAIYRDRAAFYAANITRLLGWAVGTGEIWLILRFLGQPIPMTDALILESLGAGLRAAAFMVPGALGVLEGGFVLFGSLFGLPAGTALAISLSKRVRELALGAPGLIAWQWVEGHFLLRRGRNHVS
jgi:putative membrane protein